MTWIYWVSSEQIRIQWIFAGGTRTNGPYLKNAALTLLLLLILPLQQMWLSSEKRFLCHSICVYFLRTKKNRINSIETEREINQNELHFHWISFHAFFFFVWLFKFRFLNFILNWFKWKIGCETLATIDKLILEWMNFFGIVITSNYPFDVD